MITVSDKDYMMKLWDFEKNTLDPTKTSVTSKDKVWWKCPTCNYSWQGTIYGKKNDHCPLCHGSNKTIPGYTDFRTTNPEIGQDALDSLNPGIDLNTLGKGSHERINWKCHICGYEWIAPIYGRCKRNSKCPRCAGQVRSKSFVEEYPKLREFFAAENSMKIEEIDNWRRKYIWTCKKHGNFEAALSSMIRSIQADNTGCPYCHGTKVKREESFGAKHPELLKEWNDELDPFEITENSKIEINWKCDKGHTWKAKIHTRAQGFGYCRECYPRGKSYKTVTEQIPGIDKYYAGTDDLNSHIMTETTPLRWKCDKGHEFTESLANFYQKGHFSCPICTHRRIKPGINDFQTEYPDYAKALVGDATKVSPSSNTIMTFRCSEGHEFRRTPAIHIKWHGVCPVCSRHVLVKGTNDLLTTYPKIKDIWDNGDDPSEYLDTAPHSFNFKCKNGHSFTSRISSLAKYDFKCPYCEGILPVVGENDLSTTNPEVAKDWSPNNPKKPTEVFEKSNTVALWLCKVCGNEYNRVINQKRPNDCPYCANDRVLQGTNDLLTTHPKLAAEWSKSNNRGPETVTKTHKLRVLWICPVCKGEYGAEVNDRELGDCPYCANERVLQGTNDLLTTHPKLAAEWSKSNDRGPETVMKNSRIRVNWTCPVCNGEYFSEVNDRELGDCPYCAEKRLKTGLNDLATTNPELLKEYSDNNEQKANQVAKFFKKYVLWNCPTCGGEYSYKLSDRELGDDSCPYCAGKKLLIGFNDLATTDPELAKELSENNDLPANKLMKSFKRIALWKCPTCNEEYNYSIADRELGDDSCPYCAGKKLLIGFNDLATTDPELAKELSEDNELPANELMKSFKRTALWKCPTCNEEYNYRIADRELGDDSCPYCAGKKLLAGLNDLATTDPELAKELSENNELPANKLMKSFKRTALWKCPTCNGEYNYSIADRELNDDSCPYCAGKKLLSGLNDFSTLHPDLMKEWCIAENLLKNLNANQVSESSSEKAWWKCSICGYKYQLPINKKVQKKHRGHNTCPYCNGRRQTSGHYMQHMGIFKEEDLFK